MKVKNYLEQISDVSIYPVVALTIFFIVFVLITVYAFGATKKYVQTMENLPLGTEPEINPTSQPSKHDH